MKKSSLVERLVAYLKHNPDTWFPKGQLARLAESAGYLGETAGRRLREMTEDKILDSRENQKGHVEYKWHKKEVVRSQYVERKGRMVEVKQMIFQ